MKRQIGLSVHQTLDQIKILLKLTWALEIEERETETDIQYIIVNTMSYLDKAIYSSLSFSFVIRSPCFEGTLFTFWLEKSPCCIYRVKAILVNRQWITPGGIPSDHGSPCIWVVEMVGSCPLVSWISNLLHLHTFSLMSKHKARKYHLVRDGYLWMQYMYRKN